MRNAAVRSAAFVLGALLASCGPRQPAEEQGSTEPAPAASTAASTAILGIYQAVSETAMAITGDVTVDETSLRFSQGHAYVTQVVGPLEPGTPLDAAGSDLSIALALDAEQTLEAIEVRRVASAELAATARNPGGLCGPQSVTHVLLVVSQPSEEHTQSLWAAAFTGPDAPGPEAKQSELCGTFLYMRDTAS